MKIPRYFKKLDDYLQAGKVLIIYGPRQIGKTTLLQGYLESSNYRYKLDSGDNISTQHLLQDADFSTLLEYVEGYELLAIDEAQRIPNIGQCLKVLVDQVPTIHIIATGSSAFELAGGEVGEPLTGRKKVITLYPISQLELLAMYNRVELKLALGKYLIYGSYPEVLTASSDEAKRECINEIANAYLLKDILELDKVKNSKALLDLLRLLAFQIGHEVSLAELGQKVMLDTKTVARYIDLLEKSFVIYNLRGFSRNLRKEITKKSKYYFYDTGIRNALIANFNSLDLRNDTGQLWENFLVIERLKKRSYQKIFANDYFWRTWDQHEIDLVEERDGKLFGYEFKWTESQSKPPKDWLESYPEANYQVINQENYLEFLVGDQVH